jgi:hypothetical protein
MNRGLMTPMPLLVFLTNKTHSTRTDLLLLKIYPLL